MNGEAERKVIIDAIEDSKINPETISYVELHASTTVLGDSIEITGLNNAFRKYTDKKNYCAIGTVKANIGHTEACSGITALVKVILALKNKELPPLINFNEVNPLINLGKTPFYINEKLNSWEVNGAPRRASINCLSFNGTNCNLIIEEGIASVKILKEDNMTSIFTLSATNETSLEALVSNYISFLKEENLCMKDVCFTSNTGRGHYGYRLAVICSSKEELIKALTLFKENGFKGSEEHGVFYNDFKVVSIKKQKSAGEIYQSDKAKLSFQGNSVIKLIKENKQDKLIELCRFYINGADIEWEELYKGEEVQKVSLPVYAYKKERFWPEVLAEKTINDNCLENKEVIKNEIKHIELSGKVEVEYSEFEIKLAQIWGNILGLEKLNVYDSFLI